MRIRILMILVLLYQLTNLSCQSADIYLDGMTDCVDSSDFEVIQQLFASIDQRIIENFTTINPYSELVEKYCSEQGIDDSIFKVKAGSKLDSLIIRALNTGYWYRDSFDFDKEPEIQIIPPGGKLPKKDPATIETVHLSYTSAFIECSKVYTLNRIIGTYYTRYKRLGIMSSNVKLCGLAELLEPEDIELASVQYWIAIDAIMQKMIHLNGYLLPGED